MRTLVRFHFGRRFFPYESAITPDGTVEPYLEGFTKTWVCDALLFYSCEAFYLISASLVPGGEKGDFEFSFRWVVEKPPAYGRC